jgi:hypothetical protein
MTSLIFPKWTRSVVFDGILTFAQCLARARLLSGTNDGRHVLWQSKTCRCKNPSFETMMLVLEIALLSLNRAAETTPPP